MIGRREFLTKTFKAIAGGTLILPCIPKVLYSFPTDIVLSRWYHVIARDYPDCKHLYSAFVKIFPDKLDTADGKFEVIRLLRKLDIHQKYNSWHFIRVNNLPGTEKGFIWSKTFGFGSANDIDITVPVDKASLNPDLIEPLGEMTMNLSYDVKKKSASILVDQVSIYSFVGNSTLKFK